MKFTVSYGSARVGSFDLPGIEPDADRDRAERKGREPLRAREPQCFDMGGLPLFDGDARPQPQLFDNLEDRKP